MPTPIQDLQTALTKYTQATGAGIQALLAPAAERLESLDTSSQTLVNKLVRIANGSMKTQLTAVDQQLAPVAGIAQNQLQTIAGTTQELLANLPHAPIAQPGPIIVQPGQPTPPMGPGGPGGQAPPRVQPGGGIGPGSAPPPTGGSPTYYWVLTCIGNDAATNGCQVNLQNGTPPANSASQVIWIVPPNTDPKRWLIGQCPGALIELFLAYVGPPYGQVWTGTGTVPPSCCGSLFPSPCSAGAGGQPPGATPPPGGQPPPAVPPPGGTPPPSSPPPGSPPPGGQPPTCPPTNVTCPTPEINVTVEPCQIPPSEIPPVQQPIPGLVDIWFYSDGTWRAKLDLNLFPGLASAVQFQLGQYQVQEASDEESYDPNQQSQAVTMFVSDSLTRG